MNVMNWPVPIAGNIQWRKYAEMILIHEAQSGRPCRAVVEWTPRWDEECQERSKFLDEIRLKGFKMLTALTKGEA